MTKRLSALFIVFITLITSCQNESNKINTNEVNNFEIAIVDSFKISNSEDLILDKVRDIPVLNHDETKIAWINEDRWEVFITNLNGDYITSFGSTGSGPEEFQEIAALGFDQNDNIVVFDVLLDKFKIFNLDGELMHLFEGTLEDDLWVRSRRIYIDEESIYLGIQESDKASESNHWKSATIAEYSLTDGRFKRAFGEFDPSLSGSSRLYNDANIVTDKGHGLIFTTHRTSPYIQAIDIKTGEVTKRFGVQTENFNYAEDAARIEDPMHVRHEKNLHQSFTGESFTSNEFFYHQHYRINDDVLRFGDPFHKTPYLNIYSIKGSFQFIAEVKLDYSPLFVTSEGKIYLLKDNDPENFTVNVYELL
ncbi:MAG: 6-bladed beta-propeller [Balneolaceae bacterium]